MKIKNFDELSLSDTRKKAMALAETGLEAIDTEKIIKKNVSVTDKIIKIAGVEYQLFPESKLIVIAVGKCALDASIEIEKTLGERITSGVALDVREGKLKKIKLFKGTHPLPSSENSTATKEIVGVLSRLNEKDLVLFIISGGGSTLLYLPEDKGFREEASVVSALMKAGATIQEENTVRKHLSLARGGYLAKYAYPAKAISLIFSDVPSNDIEFIASGPTVKDVTTINDAQQIIDKYDILRACRIERCGLIETPKDEKYFARVKNILIASNANALEAMRDKAEKLGFKASICTNCLTGEASSMGLNIAEELRENNHSVVLLYGGETTVTVRGNGRGGRNLELALSALRAIGPDELILTLASDGNDNNTNYAGAICDILSKKRAEELGLDIEKYLSENNSCEFWENVGGGLLTGYTGSNVSDLIIAIHG